MRHSPPFRADHVGSLLRPAELKAARLRLTGEALTEVEDAAIKDVIAKQENIGLQSATDGEFRRAMWHFDFLERLDGVESFRSDHGIAFKGGIETQAKGLRVTGKIGFSASSDGGSLPLSARPHAARLPKMTIPSPSVLHFRGGRRAVSPAIYPDMEEFYRDLGLAYRGAVQRFCRRRLPLSAARRSEPCLPLRSRAAADAARPRRRSRSPARHLCGDD